MSEIEKLIENIFKMTDEQFSEFDIWMKEQPWYKNDDKGYKEWKEKMIKEDTVLHEFLSKNVDGHTDNSETMEKVFKELERREKFEKAAEDALQFMLDRVPTFYKDHWNKHDESKEIQNIPISNEVIRAVMAVTPNPGKIYDNHKKMVALAEFKDTPEGKDLIGAFKRIDKMIKSSEK